MRKEKHVKMETEMGHLQSQARSCLEDDLGEVQPSAGAFDGEQPSHTFISYF